MKFIIANWKMNPASHGEAERLARAASKIKHGRNVEVILCMPFIYLSRLAPRTSHLSFGAQNCFWENPAGPYTGEISPAMLKNSGAKYVILGHSERRANLGETDEMVAKKLEAAGRAGLRPILCVGEPISVRKKGPRAAREYVYRQLAASLKNVTRGKKWLTVAYEPLWAIGTGVSCHPDEAEIMVRAVAATAANKLGFGNVAGLYGGSVGEHNAGEYLRREYIDGLLVGGASVDAGKFAKIIRAAEKAE